MWDEITFAFAQRDMIWNNRPDHGTGFRVQVCWACDQSVDQTLLSMWSECGLNLRQGPEICYHPPPDHLCIYDQTKHSDHMLRTQILENPLSTLETLSFAFRISCHSNLIADFGENFHWASTQLSPAVGQSRPRLQKLIRRPPKVVPTSDKSLTPSHRMHLLLGIN